MSVWKYRGVVDEDGVPDRFILGVPTRDLTEDDYAALGENERRLVDEGDLYSLRVTPRTTESARRGGEMAPVVSEESEGSTDAND